MKQEGACAGAFSRPYGPQVPPPEQVRPVLQALPLQHRSVLPPQAAQVRGPPPAAGGQVSPSAVQKAPPPPPPVPVQHGSPDPPQPPASPMQAPASHTPLLLGQSAFSAMQVP